MPRKPELREPRNSTKRNGSATHHAISICGALPIFWHETFRSHHLHHKLPSSRHTFNPKIPETLKTSRTIETTSLLLRRTHHHHHNHTQTQNCRANSINPPSLRFTSFRKLPFTSAYPLPLPPVVLILDVWSF